MENTRKISVITVVYNDVHNLEKTILSLKSQNVSNLEFLVIDGGSSDGTDQLIQKHREFINIFISETDEGIYNAMNKGVRLASGEWISFLNAGDVYKANSLSIVSDALSKRTDQELLAFSCEYISEEGYTYIHTPTSQVNEVLPHPSVFAHRDLFSKFGYFDESYKIFADAVWLQQVKLNCNVSYFSAVITEMDGTGLSSKINLDFIRECFRFRRVENNLLFAILLAIIKPIGGSIISRLLGKKILFSLKQRIFNAYQK